LGKKLLVNPSEHPMFYIEPPLSSKEYRQKLIELFFEEYEFNGLFMHKAPVLSTYLFGLESSLVVDIGAEYTHVVPVVEGFINPKGIIRANVGGESITR
jgi:actin-related protein